MRNIPLYLGLLLIAGAMVIGSTILYGWLGFAAFVILLVVSGTLWVTLTGRTELVRTAGTRLRETVQSDKSFIVKTLAGLFFIWLVVWLFSEPLVAWPEQTNDAGDVVKEAQTFSWSLLTFWLLCAYFIFSWRFWTIDSDGNFTIEGLYDAEKPTGYIRADEIAVRQIAGRQIDVLSSGLPFAPLLIVQLLILPIKVQQKEFPNEPSKIFRSKDDTSVPEGMSPPERITFRAAITPAQVPEILGDQVEEKDVHDNVQTFNPNAPKDGLAKRVTAEVVPVVRWRIKRGEATKFVKNIGSVDEANRQIEDEMFAVLARLLPNISVGQAKQNMRWISAHLYQALVKRTSNSTDEDDDGWGVEIETAYLKAIRFNHDLNGAIALAAEAEFQGRGERMLIEQRGAGDAKAAGDLVYKKIEGQVKGLVQLAEELGIEGQDAIAQFVAGQLAEGGNTVVLGLDGVSQLVGAAGAAMLRGNNAGQTQPSGGN